MKSFWRFHMKCSVRWWRATHQAGSTSTMLCPNDASGRDGEFALNNIGTSGNKETNIYKKMYKYLTKTSGQDRYRYHESALWAIKISSMLNSYISDKMHEHSIHVKNTIYPLLWYLKHRDNCMECYF